MYQEFRIVMHLANDLAIQCKSLLTQPNLFFEYNVCVLSNISGLKESPGQITFDDILHWRIRYVLVVHVFLFFFSLSFFNASNSNYHLLQV